MGSVPVSTNGAWEFHNRRTQDEDEGGCEVNCPRQEEMKSGVVKEGKDGVGEKEMRNNKSNQNVNNGHVGEDVQAQVCVQIPLKLPRVSVVCWERFLPRTTLRVLLVENDDSTRHLVFALLRNCGYEVTAATNGLQAWKILMDKTNHIDLVLTEVDMPYLSGIGLLSKIMNTECCKNIPVTMMSCTDPEVLVLKCLSKGAVSFLVKPVRKNELKILWQHVWRRCHSFSDSNSGSESGVNTKKLAKVNNAKESGNNADSNNGNENECTDLNEQDECGHDNSAQSSWRKSGADVDIPLSTLPCNELVHADSTCAQVMHPRTKACGNDQMPTIAMECCKDDERLQGDSSIETDFEIQEIKHRHLSGKDLCNLKGRKHDKLSALEPKRDDEQLKKELVELLNEDPMNKLKQLAGDLKGTISNDLDTQAENLARSGVTRVSQSRDKVVSDANDPTSVELNIKRPRDIGGTDGTFCDSRNVMKCSNLPNFLRYSIVNHASRGDVESHTHIGSNSETLRKQSKKKFSYNLNNTPDQQTNECSNENDMGSIATNAPTRSAGINKNGSINNGMHMSSPFQSVLNCPTSLSQQVIPKEGVEVAVNIFVEKPRGAKQKIQVQHHHHHHHYYHQRVHETQEEQSQDMTKVAVQSGSSNAFNRPTEVTVEKYSSSGSGSGSKRGSNVLNGSNCDVSPGETDLKSENMVPGKGEDHVSLACENRRMIDKINCSTEAGMNKFIQKRKKDA